MKICYYIQNCHYKCHWTSHKTFTQKGWQEDETPINKFIIDCLFCYLYLTDLRDPEMKCTSTSLYVTEGVNVPIQCHLHPFVFLPCFPRYKRENENLSQTEETSFTRRNHQTNLPFHFQILKIIKKGKNGTVIHILFFCLCVNNERTI